MNALTLLTLFTVALTTASAAKIVCYYSSWAIYYGNGLHVEPEDVDPHMCTHINYAFVAINGDGSLRVEDQNADISKSGYKRLTALKKQNGNLKVMLSIGGASAPAQTFSSIAANAGKRAAFVGSARWFMQTYGFDGVDIDWEVPKSGDKAHYISLLQDLRNDFNKNGWLVSAAVAADVSDGYNVGRMSQLLDHINIMTYDLYGPWSAYTGQNSALWASSKESQWEKDNLNMDASVRQWISHGAAPNKLVAGVAFYGHTFTLKNAGNHGIHAPINGPGHKGALLQEDGSLSYTEYCMQSGWKCDWDAEQKMPICTKGDQWLGIDDPGSIRNKVAYIKSKGLGGAMIWSVDYDDIHGKCGAARPLLHALHDSLN